MFTTTVESKDNKLVLSVPKDMQEQLQLKQGDQLDIEVAKSMPTDRRGRFASGQLVREHAEVMAELGQNREWVDAPAVGRELL